jgi:hypothetical protein
MGKAFTIVTLVLGSLGIFTTLMSVILMVLLRENQVIVTSKVLPPTYSPSNPWKYYNSVWDFGTSTFEYARQQSDPRAANYLHLCDFVASGTVCSSFVPDVSVSTPDAAALQFPMRFFPKEFGAATLLPDASQVLVALGPTLPPGDEKFAFGQYLMSKITDSTIAPLTFPSSNDNKGIPPFSNSSSMGTVGPKSLVVSPDGLRVYVSYSTQFKDPSQQDPAGSYMFKQMASRVAVFNRDPDSLLDTFSPNCSTSTNWRNDASVQLSCPFGARSLGPAVYSFHSIDYNGDEFGATMATSRRHSTGLRLVAIRSRLPISTIFVYEEQSGTGEQRVIAMFQLDQSLFIPQNTTFQASSYWTQKMKDSKAAPTSPLISKAQWRMVANEFGRSFSIGNDTILISITGQFQGQASTVICYRRGPSGRYSFHSFIDPPATTGGLEAFGCSVVLDPSGTQCVIGASRLPPDDGKTGGGVGGHVYFYQLNEKENKWVLMDTWNPPDGSTGAFGHWVNTDSSFTLVSTTSGMNNNPNAPTGAPKNTIDMKPPPDPKYDPDFPKLWVRSMDKKVSKFAGSAPAIQYDYFPNDGDLKTPQTYMIDPLFGAHVTMAVDAKTEGKLKVLTTYVYVTASSPLNGASGIWRIAVTDVNPSKSF